MMLKYIECRCFSNISFELNKYNVVYFWFINHFFLTVFFITWKAKIWFIYENCSAKIICTIWDHFDDILQHNLQGLLLLRSKNLSMPEIKKILIPRRTFTIFLSSSINPINGGGRLTPPKGKLQLLMTQKNPMIPSWKKSTFLNSL